MRDNNRQPNIVWLLVFLIFLPRLLNLDAFLTADEPLFLKQARDFAAGLAGGELSRTLGIGYPGVTVAWWSAPLVGPASNGSPAAELAAYTAGRIVTALVTGLLLLGVYSLAGRLLGRWPALLGAGWLALDPYSLAYSRLLHIAMPLALLVTLAGLSFLLWLADARRRWLGLAGLFTGLALLTKSTALLLGPMLLLSLLGWAVATGQGRAGRWWRAKIGGLGMIGLLAGLVFFVLWPAMWVEPGQALALTFGKLFRDQEAGAGNLGLFWWGHFVEDPGPAFYPVAFLLKSTPWLLAGLLLSLYFVAAAWLRPGAFSSGSPPPQSASRSCPAATALWLFAVTYLVFMTIASKKSIRYMLPAFPAFYLLAGLACCQLIQIMRARGRLTFFQGRLASSPLAPFAPGLLFLPFFLFTLFYQPYYFTYYNPLLLGWRWAPATLLVGWGEGLDEAARYLDHQPRSTVAAWYEWLFPVFYDGRVEPVVPQENLITAGHAVLYINQVQRDIPGPNIIYYFQTRRLPEHTVRLAGIDYAWVYPGPIAGFRPDPAPQYPLGGDFGGEVRLLGYDLHPQPRSGRPLVVTLYWRVLAIPPAERFVYVRLVDAQGRIWAKADSPPVMGLWPAKRWQPGMLIEDAQELPIPPGTPPGPYRLEVGLYDPATDQALPASGQPVGQGGGLLLGEVQLEWQSLRAETSLPQQTDARLAPNARLIGYGALPATATTGDLVPVQLEWREARPITAFWAASNNWVMFSWQSPAGPDGEPPLAQQLDELPWPVEQWGRGAMLRSQHEVIVPPGLATGRYDLAVMLHTGSEPAGPAFRLGSIEVTAPPHQFELPATARPPAGAAQLARTVTLAGYEFQLAGGDSAGQTLELRLYWQALAPIARRYKVFAQLLAADNRLVAQSDSWPAAGQRPTTGWLPQEIITDSHTLALPPELPAGEYRLITGLYDPLNGTRLPLLNPPGEAGVDAIVVAEVRLP